MSSINYPCMYRQSGHKKGVGTELEFASALGIAFGDEQVGISFIFSFDLMPEI